MNSIEDVLAALLFKYAGPVFTSSASIGFNGKLRVHHQYGRPEGVVGLVGAHYRRHYRGDRADYVDFSDSPPSYYEPDPTHPWRAEIRAELVELFDLIFEKPMTELLFMADPSGGELERELKHLRRMDP